MSNFTDFMGGSDKVKNDLTNTLFNYLKINTYSILVDTSVTWTVPNNGRYLVFLSGGGGSGAAVGNADNCDGTGGGCGDMVVKSLFLAKGDSIDITIGAGGAGVDGNGSDTAKTDGNAGDISQFGDYFSTASIQNGGVGVTDGSYISINEPSLLFAPDGVDKNGATKVYTSKELQLLLDTTHNNFGFTNGNNNNSDSTRWQSGGARSLLANGGDAGAQTPPPPILGAGSGCREYYASADGASGFALIIYIKDN